MNHEHDDDSICALPAMPNTLEGFGILHQFFRLRRREWNALERSARCVALDEAGAVLAAMAMREDGQSGLFVQLGHKGDLILVHFRRDFEQLSAAELEIGRLRLSEYLEPATSYLSVVEIGLYEATVRLHSELIRQGLPPDSPDWQKASAAELERQREKLAGRLYPALPERRYLCFYPMNKRRAGDDNWYMLPIEKRRQLMHEHGMIGRRYAGQVTQIISGSIGFDDWEWGVDLFADDPLVFKKLVYEMRFDESSARYAEFGPFHFGIRRDPAELNTLFGISE
ncbi:MAG: hydrogen peroxide-dependent heme synthase [Candidatus Binataceae bacterium]